jgi:hypothetical protein
LYLRDGIVTQEIQHDLDKLGIAKNSGEERSVRGWKQKAAGIAGRSPGPQKNTGMAHGGAVSRSGAEWAGNRKVATSPRRAGEAEWEWQRAAPATAGSWGAGGGD